MRWLWGRGSVGRAMRSQRIGQGFESPRLHHHKQTASQERCRLLMAAKPAGERTCAQHFTCACLFALFSCIQASDLSVRAGSAAAAADAFARVVARAERPACKSISPVRHLPLWRSSPRLHHHKQTASQERCRLLMAAKPAGERTCAQHFTCACLFALFSCIQASDLSVRAGSAAAAADAFARVVARAERPACKSISPVRHLPLWRSSPRLHHHKQTASQERCRLLMVAKLPLGSFSCG